MIECVEEQMSCPHSKWADDYYGYRCVQCGLIIPYGCEPWAPLDDELEDDIEPAYHCPHCNGEFGDGYSLCTCDEDDEPTDEELDLIG